MAASVEFAPEIYKGERYGHSLAGLRAMGHVALEGASFENSPIVAHNFDDFVTAITENIATDDEFGESLVVGTPKVREIVGGRVTALNGLPIVDIVSAGAEWSAALAENDTYYTPQKVRDEGDVLFAEVVDSLQIGEVAHVVSMDPKEQMALDSKRWEAVGYRKGMAVQHVAYRLDETTMLTWTYIIKQSDKNAIAEIYREDFGTEIPADTHSDLWIRNIHRSRATLQEVEQIGMRTLKRHKEITQSKIKHYSVTDFVAMNIDVLKEYFDAYNIPLSKTAVTHKNNEVIQELANSIVQNVRGLKPEIIAGLIRVANSKLFDDDDARLMQAMIRYAAVEDLRKKLPEFMGSSNNKVSLRGSEVLPHTVIATYVYNPEVVQFAQRTMQEMNISMALNINDGVVARRSLGGCSAISIAQDDQGIAGLHNNIFNKVDNENAETTVKMGKDGKGPLKFTCSKGHENEREDFKDFVEYCKDCRESVSCAPEEEKPKKASSKKDKSADNIATLFGMRVKNERTAKAA